MRSGRRIDIALAVGDDPMTRQMDIEATAGAYAGERPLRPRRQPAVDKAAQADRRRHGPHN
jgi:hypothetical protein